VAAKVGVGILMLTLQKVGVTARAVAHELSTSTNDSSAVVSRTLLGYVGDATKLVQIKSPARSCQRHRLRCRNWEDLFNCERNVLMQIGLVVCTGLGFLFTSLKEPHYGVIANLIGQVFWLALNERGAKRAKLEFSARRRSE
jgi:hypothetical protein